MKPTNAARRSSSDRLDPCYGAGSQEPPQAPSRDGIPLSGRKPGSEIEAGQVRNCDSPGTVGRSAASRPEQPDTTIKSVFEGMDEWGANLQVVVFKDADDLPISMFVAVKGREECGDIENAIARVRQAWEDDPDA